MMPYALICNGWEGGFVLKCLIEMGIPPVCLFTTENRREIIEVANANNIRVCRINNPGEIEPVCGVALVCSFKKIPDDVISRFEYGIFNIHPSYLPEYRGAAPVRHILLNDEKMGGVSIFKINSVIDAGMIYRRIRIPVLPDDDYITLTERAFRIGAFLFKVLMDELAGLTPHQVDDILIPQENNPSKRAPKIPPDWYSIKINERGRDTYRFVRALVPGAYMHAVHPSGKSMLIKIHRARFIKKEHDYSDGTILTDKRKYLWIAIPGGFIDVISIQREGKKKMDIAAFLNGFPNIEEWRFA